MTSLRTLLKRLTEVVTREIELTEIGSKIQSKVMDEVSKTQRQFYLREQMKAIQKELGEEDERTQEIAELKKENENLKARLTSLESAIAKLLASEKGNLR